MQHAAVLHMQCYPVYKSNVDMQKLLIWQHMQSDPTCNGNVDVTSHVTSPRLATNRRQHVRSFDTVDMQHLIEQHVMLCMPRGINTEVHMNSAEPTVHELCRLPNVKIQMSENAV